MEEQKKTVGKTLPTDRETPKKQNFIQPDYTTKYRFITVREAMQILQCSRQTASRAIHLTNERLAKQGFFTIQGRCNRQAFYETLGIRF